MRHGYSAKTVKQAGPSTNGTCDFAITDICGADPTGEVQPYDVLEESRQWRICKNCLNRLLQTGRWVEQKATNPTPEA